MIDYSLPKSLNISGKDCSIRYDYRAILDCLCILSDEELNQQEKIIAFLTVFYENPEDLDDLQEACDKAIKFISCNTDSVSTKRSYMNWEKDFHLIVAPVNRIMGTEIRALPELHWWTFLDAYREIGECYFQTVVSIRHKKMTNQKLEKWEQKFYRDNREDIDMPVDKEESIEDLLDQVGW